MNAQLYEMNSSFKALLFLFLFLLAVGCNGRSRRATSVGATHLKSANSFPIEHRDVVEKLIQFLKDEHHHYYVIIDEKHDTKEIIFHLYHETSFDNGNWGVVGNPGGKCLDLYYDINTGEFTKTVPWQ